MAFKTIELVIDTALRNQEVLEILDDGTDNLAELGITLREIRVKCSADSIIKGIDYANNSFLRNSLKAQTP